MSTARSRRLVWNPKALALTAAALAVVLGLGAWLRATQPGRLRATALARAGRALEEGRPDKALRHLDRFLGDSPEDVPALELKALVLAEAARGADDLREAARWNERLLRIDPGGPGRQDTRRRLAGLYIRYSDAIRDAPLAAAAPEMVAAEVRYRSAEAVARGMILADPSDGSGHRLLGMALEGGTPAVDAAGSRRAAESYESALRLDPRDAVASGRLADLCRGRLADPARARAVLDAALRADPKSVGVRLARAGHWARFGDGALASAELAEAVALAPADAQVRLMAAEQASRAGDLVAARAHLDAIPARSGVGLRARLARGLVDLADRRPDDAIEGWRAGLAGSGGSDADMTWWLAFVLLQAGRVAEAGPLVAQHARLAGDAGAPRAVLLRAMLDEKAGRPLEAIALLEKVAARPGDAPRPMVFLVLGRCREAAWDAEGALRDYREAAAAGPGDAAPRLAVARLLEARRPDEAASYLRRECRAAPADPALHAALAGMLLRRQAPLPAARRSWAEADAALAVAAGLAPGSAPVALMQADRRALDGDLDGATARLEAATRSAPRDPSAWVAYAAMLERRGRPEAALAALGAAEAAEAAGDRAAIRVAEARVLTGLGRGREARARLTRGLGDLPLSDRAAILEELGRLLAARGDPDGARAAFRGWAELVPDGLQPRLALLDLALADDDDARVRDAVAALREVAGAREIVGQLARVVEILRGPAAAGGEGPPAAGPRAAEAAKILEDIRRVAPAAPSVVLLQGQLLEGLGRADEAAAEYRRAWDRGVDVALPRLVSLLARHRRVDDLAALRRGRPADARLERLLATAARRLGDARSVEALVGASAGPGPPEARPARAEALAAAGGVDEAEALLRSRAEESGGREAPWLDLLRFQARRGRSAAASSTIEAIRARVGGRRPEVLEAGCLDIVGDRAGSERAIASALKAYPDDPDVLVAAAAVSRSAGRNAEAVARLRRARGLDPGRVGLARQLASALAQDARTPSEWQEAWDSLEPETADPEARLVRAYVQARSPDPERRKAAIGPLEELLGDLDADHPIARGAREYLIRLLVGQGQVDRAIGLAEAGAAREFDPGAVALYVDVLLLGRDFARARKQLDRWHDLAPGDRREARLRVLLIREETPPGEAAAALERAYLGRGDGPAATALGAEAFLALFALGPPGSAAAARVADRLVAADPAQSWASARLAVREGRPGDALRLARAAIDGGSDAEVVEGAQAALGVAASPGRDRAATGPAAAAIDAAVARAPRSADLLVIAGNLRHLQERYEEEAAFYRAAIDARPADAIARNNLAWVVAEDLGRPAEGLALIDGVIHDEGPDADRLGTRGVIRLRLGRLPEATRDLEESVRLRPVALTSYYLALAHRKAGRAADSAHALESARKAGLSPSEIDSPRRAEYRALLDAPEAGR